MDVGSFLRKLFSEHFFVWPEQVTYHYLPPHANVELIGVGQGVRAAAPAAAPPPKVHRHPSSAAAHAQCTCTEGLHVRRYLSAWAHARLRRQREAY